MKPPENDCCWNCEYIDVNRENHNRVFWLCTIDGIVVYEVKKLDPFVHVCDGHKREEQ